jgi:hypothetical protein
VRLTNGRMQFKIQSSVFHCRYYNSGVCQYKRGAASYLYKSRAIFSDCDILFNSANWSCP